MASGDLTDLATAQIATQIASPTVETNQILAALITAMSAYVPQVLNRNVLLAEYVDTYDGNGKREMLLRQRPVVSISSVAWMGTIVTAQGDPAAALAGIWTDGRNARLVDYCFPRDVPVQIAYSAGYATVPADLSYAVAELVAEAYARRAHVGESSRSQGGQITIAFDMRCMHSAIADRLSNYRLGAPC
jgi:hypothetical protein